jgi:hypothetical protein
MRIFLLLLLLVFPLLSVAITYDVVTPVTTPVLFQGVCYPNAVSAADAFIATWPHYLTFVQSGVADTMYDQLAAVSLTMDVVAFYHTGDGGLSAVSFSLLPCSLVTTVGQVYSLHDILIAGFCVLMLSVGLIVGAKFV